MEFRLLFAGELLPSGDRNTRPKEKHAIRQSLHPQLRRLWHTNQNLRQLACASLPHEGVRNQDPPLDEQQQFDSGLDHIGAQWNRVGHSFIPLITEKYALRCSLDILLLRPGDEKFICTQGDIDGQVKTLFDALRIPKSLEEVASAVPLRDETPFFVLLEDDRLISDVRIVTDQLLLLPNSRELKANDSFVVVNVKLNHCEPLAPDLLKIRPQTDN